MIVRWVCLLSLGTLTLVAQSLVATGGAAAEPEKVDVFVSGDGYPVYRIPSLVCTPKGTLLAFCEGRTGDDQSATDMVLKRSVDGGTTWLPMYKIDGSIGFKTAGVFQLNRSPGIIPSRAISNDDPPLVDLPKTPY